MVRKWKAIVAPGIKLNKNTYLNTIMFAVGQIVLQESEEQLQKLVHSLHLINKQYTWKSP
jgi:hypothetical protein